MTNFVSQNFMAQPLYDRKLKTQIEKLPHYVYKHRKIDFDSVLLLLLLLFVKWFTPKRFWKLAQKNHICLFLLLLGTDSRH